MGNTLLVKARFSRSFLAQLIGLRTNYKVWVDLVVFKSLIFTVTGVCIILAELPYMEVNFSTV